MHLSADISSALQQIEAVKRGIDEIDDPKLHSQTGDSLKTILDLLQDPVFRTIVHVQDSLSELNAQLTQHPSMLPNDFDIDMAGNLVLSVNGGDVMYEFDERLSTPLNSASGPNSPGSSKAAADVVDPTLVQHTKMPSLSGVELFPTDYVQIQAIELVNDGTGLGFGIIGARTSGVIVKTILPGGVADRDGRLRSGDHILQIGDVNLQEMVSEQVATVLRQSGTHVRLVVGRAIEHPSPIGLSLDPGSAVVPARVLVDRAELERYLISTGYPEIFGESSNASTPQTTTEDERFVYRGKQPIIDLLELPETEKLQVELTKDANGLGITIAGYVCEKEELSGIFVKSVSPGSAADLNGRIRVNDRIIEVDGQSLQGFSNHQAVELLKQSGQVVNLRLERYLRGPKYEQLQQAIAANDKIPSVPSTPSRSTTAHLPSSSITPMRSSTATTDLSFLSGRETLPSNEVNIFATEPESFTLTSGNTSSTITTTTNLSTFGVDKNIISLHDDQPTKIITSDILSAPESEQHDLMEPLHAKNNILLTRQKYYTDPELTADVEQEIIRKWKKNVGPDVDVIVAQIKKFPVGGLGISLEGTVDVEGGREVRPHHYIRSILADGPVGVNGKLRAGDELLEVNGQRLFGMNHLEVVAILKELPQDVRMVCGRSKTELMSFSDDTLQKLSNNFENLVPASDRLVKAKSDGNLATTSPTNEDSFKLKSRSLEPLTGLAMWSSEPQIIELIKGDRGLGFSILDYQDPMDSNDCLIVIRSLVPGGVAQLDGRLIPGDRLLFVNNINLENATLDQAVQALKGAAKGVVRIGVAKPLPMTDTSLKTNSANTSQIDSELDHEDNTTTNTAGKVGEFKSLPPSTNTMDSSEPDLISNWRK
ncbi:Patj-like protein [Lucilia cuprina]|uniref:Patj-like protein n=1 Tax=Lucilia cuprina TaxID=7375 RepID=A0A0L0CMK0_LUCCU|nr:Patj-like protein [Lucilia cuprina]